MGISALRDLAAIEPVTLAELSGAVVAVDAHNWLYRYLTTTVRWTRTDAYTTHDGTEVPNLIGIVSGLPKFFDHDIVPVFVFDGEVTELKADEIATRRAAKEAASESAEAAREAGDTIEAARYEARTQRLTDPILRTTRELFDLLDVPHLDAPAEGEAQAAHMARNGDVDYVGTEDYDSLLFGAPLTIRNLTGSGDQELMDLEKTLAANEITQTQLVDVAILCGTDFNEGVSGMGPKTSLQAVREHGDLWGVLEAEAVSMPSAEAVRTLFLEPSVTDDYAFDTELSPDVDAARAFVVEQWEVPADEVDRGFDRIEDSFAQPGLDRWM